jgi:Tfp pilus assembly protein PilO
MTKKSNSTFYGGVTVLIVICSFIYSWKFLVPKYNTQKAEIKVVEDELKMATNKLESIKTTKVTLESLKPITNQLFIAVPGDKDSPNLITELEALALKNKIVIPSIQIAEGSIANSGGETATASSGANAVSISFAVSGSFENLNSLIVSIEKDIRFMNIKSFSFSANEKDSNQMSLTLQIEAYRRSASAATATSSRVPSATTNATGE